MAIACSSLEPGLAEVDGKPATASAQDMVQLVVDCRPRGVARAFDTVVIILAPEQLNTMSQGISQEGNVSDGGRQSGTDPRFRQGES